MVSKIDEDERTSALGLFNTARSYWRSAEHLDAARLKLTHPQAPVRFLFCHAIELYLKSYLRSVGNKSIDQLRQMGHHVANLAKAAVGSSLVIEPEQFEILAHIADTDVAIEARYIVTGFKNLPTNDTLSNVAEVLDKTICNALAKKGIPVRAEKFTRPEPLPARISNDLIEKLSDRKIAELEKKLTPRVITDEQEKLIIEKIKPFFETPFGIEFDASGDLSFKDRLIIVLQRAR
jgi:hypothetical protein